MDRCKISEWQVVLHASDRVNIPCFMQNDTDEQNLTLVCTGEFDNEATTEAQ